ncbi:hypothetical protein [Geoglobus acetivorans]
MEVTREILLDIRLWFIVAGLLITAWLLGRGRSIACDDTTTIFKLQIL